MQTQQLKQKIKQQGEIAHGKGNAFQDLAERIALRNFLANCPDFQGFWKSYFGTLPNITLKDDPLGEYKVDLGIVDNIYGTTIYGLIEVDVFNSWGEKYPAHYKKFHVLERKLKYFLPSDYNSETLRQGKPGKPYITCTFNRYHNQMCSTTKENIVRCLHKYGVQEIYMPKIDAYDRVIRCPLDENIHWFGVE